MKPDQLSKKLGYNFNQPLLLEQAFCHASYANENPGLQLKDNERLEFLGDAVIDLVISHLLMEEFPDAKEGDLSKYRAMIVDETGLYEIALGLELGDYLLLGKGEEQGSGRQKPSILANTMEALCGAVYLDGGFQSAMEVIGRCFRPLLDRVGKNGIAHDFKSLLQEFTQRNYKTAPNYHLINETGPDHNKTFTIGLSLQGKVLAQGTGKSKKEAEQNAAREAFFCLQRE